LTNNLLASLVSGSAIPVKRHGVSGVVSGGAFSPSDISDMVAWWDFSELSSITKNGSDRISQVDDLSGNDYHLTEGTASLQPLWEEGIQNSLDIGNFTDSRLMRASWTALSQPHTVAGAVKMPVGNTSGLNIYDVFNNDEGGSGGGFANDDTQKLAIFSASDVKISDSGYTDAWSYFVNIYGSSADLRMDGSSLVTGDSGTVDYNGMTVNTHRSVSTYGQILCGELIVYDKLVSGNDLSNLETYLADKWGL